ncbi:MAG TPA: ATP-binding protein, partial [Myxococcaceae bacterium]|nr:ATP-binding protein [Myxococcaceae bacterium]
RSELDGSLPLLSGDPGLLKETLENLLRNAAEALPEGGNVMVRTGWRDRSHVYLSVQDDGVGIDARTRERLKEFYTTKPGGSGLGLAFARRVAETHGGELKIESQPGKGTTVTVALAAPPR